MKAFFIFLIVVFVVLSGLFIGSAVVANYEYENKIASYWSLADRASTLQAKSQYIDLFVMALADQHLEGSHDALIFSTPQNGFDQNFAALKTLQERMHQIETMDERSLEYQQAILQITAQEQGEAANLLDVFEECYYKHNHFMLWGWMPVVISIGLLAGIVISVVVVLS
jgi:hypothetical protein